MVNWALSRRIIRVWGLLTGRVSGSHSQRRIILGLSLIVGLCAGLAAFVLKFLVEEIKTLLTAGFQADEANWRYLVYPAVGILLTSFFVRYVVRDDISHGVTKILYAISRKRARIKSHNRWTSVVASAITIGFGGSVGAEAPIVLTGSAFGSYLGKRFHLPPGTLMLLVGCGAAGAVAGIFKAPIAGMMFVLEVLMLDLNMASLLPLLVTSITAVCVSYALYGTESMFTFTLEQTFNIAAIPGCIVLGICCGLVSLYFTRTMNALERVFAWLRSPWRKFMFGAGLLGVLIFFFPALYGEGYDVISQLIMGASPDDIMHNTFFYGGGTQALLIYLALVLLTKVMASSATNGGGGCGGVFAPSLFVGALTGFVFATLWDMLFPLRDGGDAFVLPKNCVLYGMAGLMSGVMHAPLTGIFLIAELTGGYQLFVPIMIVSAVSYLTINAFEPHSIYAMRLARKGELITHDKDDAILTVLHLDALVEKNFVAVEPDWDLGKVTIAVTNSRRNLFPVVDKVGHLLGVVSLDSIRKVMFRPELYHQYTARAFMKEPPAVLGHDDSLKDAARKFDETRAWSLPVVDADGKFSGFISRSGLFNSYRKTLVDFTAE
ncbi:MAG: chloride channel protein [Prevotellaceae bacterium]|nr:chloride channel protein [Prevotellaceae bacterium]